MTGDLVRNPATIWRSLSERPLLLSGVLCCCLSVVVLECGQSLTWGGAFTGLAVQSDRARMAGGRHQQETGVVVLSVITRSSSKGDSIVMDSNQILLTFEDFNKWAEDERRRLQDKAGTAETLRRFDETCAQVRALVKAAIAGGMGEVRRMMVETVKSTANLFHVVAFRGAFKAYSGTKLSLRDKGGTGKDLLSLVDQPTSMGPFDENDYISSATFCFGEADAEWHVIQSLPTSDPGLIRRFQQSGTQVFYAVTGILLPVMVYDKAGTGEMDYRLLLLDVRSLNSPLDLVEPTKGELEDAGQWIAQHNGRSMLLSMRQRLMADFDILDVGDPQYLEALDATVLSGSSHGLVNGENGRIHDLLISPPGGGKGRIAKVAAEIQPIYRRVEAQAITEDGLYGNSGFARGTRVVRAGLVPQSHQGVFIIEDFHQTNSLKNRRLVITFTYTMETGRCEAGNASRASYDAQVAFHVDANRISDVDARKRNIAKLKGLARITEDTGIPTNVLGRFDYISEFTRDPRRQILLSLGIARREVKIREASQENSGVPGRLVKVALALLRTRYPEIEIDQEVASYLERRLRSIINVKLEVFNEHPEYGDFMSRVPKTYRKFVAAHARLCARPRATKEDIDAVFPFVLRKIETVLGWIVGDANDEMTQQARKEARQVMFRIVFRGKTVTLDEARKCVSGVSDKTIKRDLEDICGGRNVDGTWSVPDVVPPDSGDDEGKEGAGPLAIAS